ncbi:cytochrome c-550 PedF [Poseidonocella sp. HB161398]|uniref:cytochrome c-550 PedF n=1 Tax=Poseidonocella sp. HB161398 TaxID=2320855 RepID=UPI001107BDA9|nr:cytochrome c-550 PedF [Poseidonocella sp. HB161398]
MLFRLTALGATILAATTSLALAHGDVAPQPVNTDALPDLADPEEWMTENPYRGMGDEVYQKAIEIGSSGYTQNCARCHGLEVISGGLAPDLRFLEAEEYGDEWFVERFRHGYTQNGTTKMPAFGELLGQKAAWAIRTYIETRPDDAMVTELTPELMALKGQLEGEAPDIPAISAQLGDIAGQIETLSGAPVADSVARKAQMSLASHPENTHRAVEILTVGLSAAH